MVVKRVAQTQKHKYPKSVFFIISNEFCERFSYYGMRAILTLYLTNKLNYDNNTATVIYHVFTMFVYFFPLIGAMLSDSWLGKFRTIFYVSIIYAVGQLLLALAAAPVVGLPPVEFSMIGMLLIALGTGGIKPCVAAFGGDQFILPQQERYLSTFFSLFYFSINSGSLISSFLTPLIRTSVTCFGENTCYSLAFFIPAALMTLSIVIFLLGKPLYRVVQPTGNVVLKVSKCVSHGIYAKVTSKGAKREHWLDYADDKFDRQLIDDIKATLQVLKLFIPLPVFWALFDQQGSRWTIQATRMDGQMGNFLFEPDQMQVFNPLLVLAFIPLFETCIYPLLAKVNLHTPLKKLTIGGLLAALSFVISGLVELKLETTYPVLPSEGLAQLRIYNNLDCKIPMTIGQEKIELQGLSVWKNIDIKANGIVSVNYNADVSDCQSKGLTSVSSFNGALQVQEAMAISWIFNPDGLNHWYIDDVNKPKKGNPMIRSVMYVDPNQSEEPILRFTKKGETILQIAVPKNPYNVTAPVELKPDTYDIYMNNKVIQSKIELKLGGVYAVTGFDVSSSTQKYAGKVVTVTEPNSMHILWLLPQYVVITMGEVMFSVTGLEFAFTQAPASMKSLLQASWLLTVAFGNLIVVIIAEASVFSRQMYEFFLFAGLMFLDILIFAVMAVYYKYVNMPDDEVEEIDMDAKGVVNDSYKDDEK